MSNEEATVQVQQPEQKPDAPAAESPAAEQQLAGRALVLTGHGGMDKVKLQMKTQRQPRAGEVLLRVKACGLNFADLMGRLGHYELMPSPPFIMGMEGSGIIEAVGEGVKDRQVGDRVIALCRTGAWQEFAIVPIDHTFLMPDSMSFEEGAALPVNYLTAHIMLFEMANLKPGKSILIHMAAGGVGVAATQLCKTVDDVTVFGTSSASKHETISANGVTHPIDYRTKDYVEEIQKISPKGLDIVLDPLGGSDTQKGFGLLKSLGTIVVFGAANIVTGQKKNLLAMAKLWYNQLSLSSLKLMQSNKAICGFHLGFIPSDVISKCMSTLLDLYRDGKIKPCIDSCYHFEDVAEAMRRMHDRQNIGKVILLPEVKKGEAALAQNVEPTVEPTQSVAEEGKAEAGEEAKEETS